MEISRSRVVVAIASAAAVVLLAGFFLPVEAILGLGAVLFVLAATVIAVTLQLQWPFLGLALLVVMAVAYPFEYRGPSGVRMNSALPLAAGFCGVWLLRLAMERRATAFDGSRVVYAAFVFSGVALAAFVVGQFPWFPAGAAPLPAQVAELGLFLLSVCLFLAVADQLHSLTELKWLTGLFLAAGLMAAVIQSIPSLAFVGRWTTRPASIGSLFWTWLVALSFAQALFNRHLSTPTRLLLLGINALVLYHGLVQVRSWASGWIPPLAAMGIILLFKIPRLSIGLSLVAAPVALFFAGFISTVLLGDEEYSLMTRQEAWAVLWNLVQRSPLLGTGPANYYYFTENFPILGWYVRFISHNNYQDLLVQTGFLGLLAFAWLSFEIGSLTLRLYRRVPAGFAQAYVIGALGGLIGSLVSGMLGDWIIPFYYNAGILGFRSSLLFWVFLGGILALKRMTLSPAEVPARIHVRAALPGDRRSFAEVH